jgi:hypothetical protein
MPKINFYYKCVHRGGHHQVWCNGIQHIKTYFSITEDIRSITDITKYDREFTVYDCDCEKFSSEHPELLKEA